MVMMTKSKFSASYEVSFMKWKTYNFTDNDRQKLKRWGFRFYPKKIAQKMVLIAKKDITSFLHSFLYDMKGG